MNRVADMNVLLNAFDQCRSGSDWKASTQRYEANVMLKTLEIKQSIESGAYHPSKCKEFILSERGKVRPVKAPAIEDRVVAKAHNQQILLPEIHRRIIYDNGASIQGRGNDFARQRFETHIHKHYRERVEKGLKPYNGGYALFADFTKFFDNVPHEELKGQFHEFTDFPEENALTDLLIDAFAPDVSYMNDEEYAAAMSVPYNSLEHMNYQGPGEKLLHKSLNIGSETSQSGGVYYPHAIDNYFKIVRGEKYYGRYMDDINNINDDKERLKQNRADLEHIASEAGLFINQRKTQIVPLNRPFVWLKVKYRLTESGKLYRLLHHDTIVRERIRIKKHAALIAEGKMSRVEAVHHYRSWRGNAVHYDNYRSIGELDKLFKTLIGGF